MDVRCTLVLRLYRSQAAATGALGVCEDPQSGNQQPFSNAAQLWAIVERWLDPEASKTVGSNLTGDVKP